MNIIASYEYDGFSDSWSGNGRRVDDDAGCCFASYGPESTLKGIVDQLVNDTSDFDSKSVWEDANDDEIREAILDVFDGGQEEYDDPNAGPCEIARDYGMTNNHLYEEDFEGKDEFDRTCDCCSNDYPESPQIIVLLEIVHAPGRTW